MRFDFQAVPATFLERPNRFLILARLRETEQVVQAHCPNPGRMHELLIPGTTVYLSPAQNPQRKTAYTLRFVEHPEHGQLISLTTTLPNALFAEGLAQSFFPQFRACTQVEAEVSLANASASGVTSRMDFRLQDPQGRACWVEVKSVTLVEDGLALFPDAPTVRGRRHVEELMELAAQGDRAAVVFIVQRPDAERLSPNWETDPNFARTLQQASQRGVELYAYTCRITLECACLERAIPVEVEKKD